MRRPRPRARAEWAQAGAVLMTPGSAKGPGLSKHRAFPTVFPLHRVVLTPHLREHLLPAHQIGFTRSYELLALPWVLETREQRGRRLEAEARGQGAVPAGAPQGRAPQATPSPCVHVPKDRRPWHHLEWFRNE